MREMVFQCERKQFSYLLRYIRKAAIKIIEELAVKQLLRLELIIAKFSILVL